MRVVIGRNVNPRFAPRSSLVDYDDKNGEDDENDTTTTTTGGVR